ncbi:hypothetical protein ACFV0Q_34620, partial [Streptomyces sp. NPDC059564]
MTTTETQPVPSTGTRPAGRTPACALLPAGQDLADVLCDLSVAHEDIPELLAVRDLVIADHHLSELLERGVEDLFRDPHRIHGQGGTAWRPAGPGTVGRCFP